MTDTVTTLPTTTRHPDGFGGACDEAILNAYAALEGINQPLPKRAGAEGLISVQAVARTIPMLHRAGVRRARNHAWYPVQTIRDAFCRHQLKPA